jgi:uncharacterized protein (TIGR02594 family)
MKWLEIAWAEIGVQETSGADATPAIVGYFRDSGRPEITSDETAWCAAFVGACLERAGIAQTIAPHEALLARSFLKVGTPIDQPRMGAIAVFSRGSNPIHGHVGFVVGWTETDIVLLGGNQANRVSTQHYPRSRLLGLRWPGGLVTPKDLTGSRIAQAAARQKKDAAKAGAPQIVPAPDSAAPAAPPAVQPPAADIAPVPQSFDARPFPAPQDLAEQGSLVQSWLEQAASFGSFAAARWPWIIAAVTLYYGARMAWDAVQIRLYRAEDASTGKTA